MINTKTQNIFCYENEILTTFLYTLNWGDKKTEGVFFFKVYTKVECYKKIWVLVFVFGIWLIQRIDQKSAYCCHFHYHLPNLVNIVKERPPCLVCYLLLYQIHSDQWVQVISWFWRQKTCMYVSMNVMYNSCKNTSRWLLQTNLSRSKSGVQLWALTRLASKKRNKKPKRMMRVLIL